MTVALIALVSTGCAEQASAEVENSTQQAGEEVSIDATEISSEQATDYTENEVALYTFVVMTSDNKPCPGVQVNLTSDTVNETLTTNENSMATYFTENPQDFKVTLSGLPDGYVSEETEVTTGLNSGYKILYVTKN